MKTLRSFYGQYKWIKPKTTKRFKAAVVLEGRAYVLTCISRCQQSWKPTSIPLKRYKEQGEENAWVTSVTDMDLIRQQGLSHRAHHLWRTTEGDFGLIQQLCLSSSVVLSLCFQQSANTSMFVFAYARLQVNDLVLTLTKQRPISALMLTSLRWSHHRIWRSTRTLRTLSTVSQKDRPEEQTLTFFTIQLNHFHTFLFYFALKVDW